MLYLFEFVLFIITITEEIPILTFLKQSSHRCVKWNKTNKKYKLNINQQMFRSLEVFET